MTGRRLSERPAERYSFCRLVYDTIFEKEDRTLVELAREMGYSVQSLSQLVHSRRTNFQWTNGRLAISSAVKLWSVDERAWTVSLAQQLRDFGLAQLLGWCPDCGSRIVREGILKDWFILEAEGLNPSEFTLKERRILSELIRLSPSIVSGLQLASLISTTPNNVRTYMHRLKRHKLPQLPRLSRGYQWK